MEQPIKHSELIEPGNPFESIKEGIDELLKVLELLKAELKKTARELIDFQEKQNIASKTGRDGTRKVAQEINGLSDEQKKLLKTERQLLNLRSEVSIQEARLRDQITKRRAEQKSAIIIEKAEEGSLARLSLQLKKLKDQYRLAGESGRTQLIPQIQKLDAQVKKLDATIGNHQRNVGNYKSALAGLKAGYFAVVAAGAGVISMFQRSLAGMDAQKRAEKSLEVALGYVNKKLIDQASALQKRTRFEDDAIVKGQAFLAMMGATAREIEKLTPLVLDFAEAKGMDLTTAFDLVAKSAYSSTNALSRYGIETKGIAGSSERLTLLTENLDKAFAGQAEAALVGAGALTVLKNLTGDVLEQIAELIIYNEKYDKGTKNVNTGLGITSDILTKLNDRGSGFSKYARTAWEATGAMFGMNKAGKDFKNVYGIVKESIDDADTSFIKAYTNWVKAKFNRIIDGFKNMASAVGLFKKSLDEANASYIGISEMEERLRIVEKENDAKKKANEDEIKRRENEKKFRDRESEVSQDVIEALNEETATKNEKDKKDLESKNKALDIDKQIAEWDKKRDEEEIARADAILKADIDFTNQKYTAIEKTNDDKKQAELDYQNYQNALMNQGLSQGLQALDNFAKQRGIILNAQVLADQIRGLAQTIIALTVGTAKTAAVGFPQNIPLLIGFAGQVAGLIGTIRSMKAPKTKYEHGGSGYINDIIERSIIERIYASGGSGELGKEGKILEGNRHYSGGVNLGAIGEAERGEYFGIVNRPMTRRYRDDLPSVFETLNKGTFHNVFTRANEMHEIINRTTLNQDPYTRKMYQLMKKQPAVYTDSEGNQVLLWPTGKKRVIKTA